MATKTRAALLVGPRQIEMREFAIPQIGEDEGLLRVETTGVCGVDWPAYSGKRPDRFKPPMILGHEIVGRVAQIGKKAAARWGVQEGDRVAMEEYAPCGRCEFCKSGHYYLCGGMQMHKMYGFTSFNVAPGLWGGFSEYVYLDPHALLHKISDSVPTAIAPLYIAISNGIRWVQGEAGIGIGDTVVILGPGQLGLACTVAAKEAGARNIIVTGRASDAAKLAVARDLGATHTIDVENEPNVVERLLQVNDGRLADAVVNVTSYAPTTIQQAVELVKMRGTIVMAGGAGGPAVGFEPDLMIRKEVTMRGVRGRMGKDMQKSIRILESGKHPLHKLATHKFSIEETERALLTIGGQGEKGAIHVSVLPDPAAH